MISPAGDVITAPTQGLGEVGAAAKAATSTALAM
jgi:hypothetical protein